MAQKTLNAFVVIGGRVDNSFGQIGTALINLGSTVDEISQKLIDFGKDSLNVYKNYEYSITELESVWGSNGTLAKGSRELQKAMEGMELAASQWAASSIFHTNDIANAMVEAAHAGWDYEQMLEGIPNAMAMAQAGGMDLSTALDYVVKAQRDFGWQFEDIPGMLDKWIYAANRSAGTAQEFGDTFLRLGSVVRLGADTEELLTLTKAMHDMGATGSEAGTLIKSSLMKLYAPSKKAGKLLEEVFGWTKQDVNDEGIQDDKRLIGMLETLESHGFQTFDEETGQIKPVLETYRSLGKALVDISGYTQGADESLEQFYQRVSKHHDVMQILSEVFGIRGMQGAMNMLMSLESAGNVYDELIGGAAEGTTEYVRGLMEDTLYGSTELFKSKVEELQRRVGEALAPDVENVQQLIGDIVEDLSALDDSKFNAVVGGLKTVALAGPGLIMAGSALRFIGMLLTPAGLIGMGAVTLAGIVSYLNEIKEADFKDQFGDMPLDTKTLNEYVKTLGEDFNTAFERVDAFAGALDTAATNYEKASSTFSSDLLTAMLTKKEFTPEEKQAFEQMGIDIYGEVLAAINASSDMAAEFWNTLYGGDEVSAADPKYQHILELLNKGNEEAISQAGNVAERLKAAMVKGFEEGFTPDDYETILGLFREWNALIAEAQNEALTEEQFIQQEKWLHKAQTASLDEIQELAKTVALQRDIDLAELEDRYLTERARLKYYGATEEELSAPGGVDEKYNAWKTQYEANYDEFLATLWESQTRQSDLGEAYKSLGQYADMYMSGQFSPDTILNMITDEMGKSVYAGQRHYDHLWNETTREKLGKVMGYMVSSLGGEDALASRIEYYNKAGNTEKAEWMQRILAMEQLVNGFSDITKSSGDFETTGQDIETYGQYLAKQTEDENRAMMAALLGLEEKEYTASQAEAAMMYAGPELESYFNLVGSGAEMYEIETAFSELSSQQKQIYYDIVRGLEKQYDFYKVNEGDEAVIASEGSAFKFDYAMWKLMNMGDQQARQYQINPPAEPEPNTSGFTIEGAADEAGKAFTEAQETLDELGDVSIGIEVTGGEETAAAAYKRAQTYANAHPVVFGAVFGGGGGAMYTPFGADGLLDRFKLRAKGGRGTEPSIFAEAGIPEWFIPEEHTPNTAKLILGAAYGSGFDIFDLAEAAGARLFAEGGTTGGALQWSGMPDTSSGGGGSEGGTGGGGGIQVQYSPVIHTDNAAGVERVLKEDKKRFTKWMEEWWERHQLYESMVMYQ